MDWPMLAGIIAGFATTTAVTIVGVRWASRALLRAQEEPLKAPPKRFLGEELKDLERLKFALRGEHTDSVFRSKKRVTGEYEWVEIELDGEVFSFTNEESVKAAKDAYRAIYQSLD